MQIKLDKSAFDEFRKEARKRLLTVAKELTDYAKVKVSRGRRGSIGDTRSAIDGEPPHVDTGRLRNSIFWGWADERTIRVGTSAKHGLWMEIGVPQITPKHGKYLAIPMSKEAINHRRMGGSPKTFPIKLHRVMSTGRPGVIFLVANVKGKHQRSVIHYVLVSSVRLPPHPYLRPSLNELTPRIRQIFGGG